MKKKIKSTKSSGNVFADLGVPDADEHFVKSHIGLRSSHVNVRRCAVIMCALNHDRVFIELYGFVNSSRNLAVQRKTDGTNIDGDDQEALSTIK